MLLLKTYWLGIERWESYLIDRLKWFCVWPYVNLAKQIPSAYIDHQSFAYTEILIYLRFHFLFFSYPRPTTYVCVCAYVCVCVCVRERERERERERWFGYTKAEKEIILYQIWNGFFFWSYLMINSGMSIRLELYYAERLGNLVHWIFIFTLFVLLF